MKLFKLSEHANGNLPAAAPPEVKDPATFIFNMGDMETSLSGITTLKKERETRII